MPRPPAGPSPFLAVLALALLVAWFPPTARAGGGPAETVVLVNTRSDDSQRVAAHYAEARDIPPTHLLEVDCPTTLETSMAEFAQRVVEPVREFLARGDRRTRVRFLVLTQGMPIRARTLGGNWVSTAATLQLIHTPVAGSVLGRMPSVPNPLYRGARNGRRNRAAVNADDLLYVTALLSSTADEAIALIDRSVASEDTAPAGALCIFQDANGNAKVRNGQYDAARGTLEKRGLKTTHDAAGPDVVKDRKRVIAYMSGGAYSKLTPEGVATNQYLPGALSDMLQSFGAVPENFEPGGAGKQFPVTHMVRAGITGVHGAVAEPYTLAFGRPQLFEPYFDGWTLAETYHRGLPWLYWMNLVLGDPLCAPYAERPKVSISAPTGTWAGDVQVKISAVRAARTTLYVDGRTRQSTPDASNTFTIHSEFLSDGPHHILVQSEGRGASAPRGWSARTVQVLNAPLAVLGRPDTVRPGGPLTAALSRTPAADETVEFVLGRKGSAPGIAELQEEFPGTTRIDGDTLAWTPDTALPSGADLVAVARVGASEVRWNVRVGAAGLAVDAPEEIAAGTAIPLAVRALDAAGNPLPSWKGRVDVRMLQPPVRLASITAQTTTEAAHTVPITLTKAGTVRFSVRALPDGVSRDVEVRVVPGPVDHVTTGSTAPRGQRTDLVLLAEDAHGNRVPDFEGTIRASVPNDRFARVPAPATFTAGGGGRAVLRDILFVAGGNQRLVFEGADGRTWSRNESIRVVHGAVRSWFVSTPAHGADAALIDPTALDPVRDGDARDGLLFRRLRATGDEIRFPEGGTRDGDACVAVTYLECLNDVQVRVLAAARAKLWITLDGETVFDDVPKQKDPRKRAQQVATLPLSRGSHRLAVVALRKGRFGFRVRLANEKNQFEPSARVELPEAPPPKRFVVSGTVLQGKRGRAGVELVARDAGGKTRRAETRPDGTWWFEDLPPGQVTVSVDAPGSQARPATRTVQLVDGNATGVRFVLVDETPPQISITGLPRRPKFGKRVRLVLEIEESGGIAEVRATLGGAPLGQLLRRGPWVIEADVSALTRGTHELVVTAVDDSGNQGSTGPQRVQLVRDVKGPSIRVSGAPSGGKLKRKTTLKATVKDNVAVAAVAFLLDGKPVGAERRSAPHELVVDPAALGAGTHEVVIVARDLDGNETRKKVVLKVK